MPIDYSRFDHVGETDSDEEKASDAPERWRLPDAARVSERPRVDALRVSQRVELKTALLATGYPEEHLRDGCDTARIARAAVSSQPKVTQRHQ